MSDFWPKEVNRDHLVALEVKNERLRAEIEHLQAENVELKRLLDIKITKVAGDDVRLYGTGFVREEK